ncbi:MAG: ribosome hibernation-promoting factor, HPF/YfiA family [Candidatus Binatia bacterium]
MQVTVTFRHVRPTPALRRYAEEKVQRVSKYVRGAIEAHVILSVDKKSHRAEINLHAIGKSLFSEEETSDLYSAIDLALDKIERQVKKLNAKRKNHQSDKNPIGGGSGIRFRVLASDRVDEHGVPEIIRTRRIPAKPMSVEEAVMQMGLTKDEFLVFRNAVSESLSVIYRRKDGNYGLIEPEASE